MAMESMSTAFAAAFKSERLVYKTIEDTDVHKDWLWKNLWTNPVNMGLATLATFFPPSQRNFKKDWEMITTKTLVAVFICVPPPEETGVTENAKAADSNVSNEGKEDDAVDDYGTIIGMICLTKYGLDAFKRRTGIGLQIADKYQNKGYGREAINWALDWAFRYGDMHRVDIGTSAFNDRAAALYESIGFKREGVVREVFFMNRKWWDLIEFGMLVHEWEELRGLREPKGDVPVQIK